MTPLWKFVLDDKDFWELLSEKWWSELLWTLASSIGKLLSTGEPKKLDRILHEQLKSDKENIEKIIGGNKEIKYACNDIWERIENISHLDVDKSTKKIIEETSQIVQDLQRLFPVNHQMNIFVRKWDIGGVFELLLASQKNGLSPRNIRRWEQFLKMIPKKARKTFFDSVGKEKTKELLAILSPEIRDEVLKCFSKTERGEYK